VVFLDGGVFVGNPHTSIKRGARSTNIIRLISVAIEEPLPSGIRARLRRYPFTRQERAFKQRRKASPREIIQAKLEINMEITEKDIDFLKQHPEDARWLKKNVDSRHWHKLASLCNFVEEE